MLEVASAQWRTIFGAIVPMVLAIGWPGGCPAAAAEEGVAKQIDGRLAAGEWDAEATWSGVVGQFDGDVDPRPVTFFVAHDAAFVYVAQRSTVAPREWSPRTPPIWFEKGDSSFVIGLAPGRKNRGDESSHYLLRVNLHGETIGHEITAAWKGVRLTFPHPAWEFGGTPPRIASGFNADKTEWTTEVAIPLAALGVERIGDGEDWGVFFARDYEAADQNAVARSSDWRFGFGRRHYGLAFFNHYRLEREWPRLTFGHATANRLPPAGHATAAAVPDLCFTGYHKGGGLAVTTAELERYGVYTGLPAKEIQGMPAPYDPITSDFYGRLDIEPLALPADKPVRGEVVIRKAGQAEPVARRVIADVRQAPTLRLHLPDLAPGIYQATASIFDDAGTLAAQARQNFIRYDHAKDMPFLGNRLGVSDEVLPPWIPVTRGGRGTEPAGTAFSVWGRTYRVTAAGLLAGIDTVAQSGVDMSPKDILAGPMRLELMQNGTPTPLSPSRLQDIEVAPHEARWRGELTGKGWQITTRCRMEYDGYVEHRLTIAPQGEQRVDGVRLVIPLVPEEATHLHAAAGDWFRAAVSAIALGGDHVPWHSGRSHGLQVEPHTESWGRLMMAGDFKPYVWVGGANRGLAFMADNDRGWVPDDERKTHSIEVVRDGGRVNLILNLVARPFTFTGAREIVFSLQATPIRPYTPEDYQRTERLWLLTAFPGYDADGWCWNGMQFQDGVFPHGLSGHGSQPYPLDWDRQIRRQKDVEARQAIFTPYQSQLNVMSWAEVDDPRMPPGKQVADAYGYLFPHVAAGCLEHGNLNITRPDIEYRLWCYARWIKEIGLKGLYFDQTEPILGANPAAGAGYVLDLPDRPALHGRVQPGYLLTNTREFYKRLRTIFVENGVADPMLWLHTTDANMISAFAFADAFLEGENWPELTPENPWFSKKYAPERMQALGNSGGKLGIPTMWLDMFSRGYAWPEEQIDRHYLAGRSLVGYGRLHDFNERWGLIRRHASPFNRAQPTVFLPYWDPRVAAALQVDTDGIMAGGYRQGDRLEVLVFNRTDEPRTGVTVRVDAKALGLVRPAGTTLTATAVDGWLGGDGKRGGVTPDLSMSWQPADDTGTLTLSLAPHDARSVVLQAGEAGAATAP